ncbi:MAG: phosphoadenylyl-sulfate reductase [Planctomycetales bacterium]|nr:phosphoadenylyl-sulfate reductase [Planctomycetales bacterium]
MDGAARKTRGGEFGVQQVGRDVAGKDEQGGWGMNTLRVVTREGETIAADGGGRVLDGGAVGGRSGRSSLEWSEVLVEELAARSAELEGAEPGEIIGWAVERYGDALTMATAFGPEGMVILHLLASIAPQTHVFNLDTGYQFPETLELRERVHQRYGIEVEFKRPESTVEQYELQHGGPVYQTDPDRCCFDRKMSMLREAAAGYHAWISAIRRDQSPDRAKAPIVGWDKKFGLVKVNPLVNMTKKDIWKMIVDHEIPYNPLHDQGYTSIGCWPCTRAVMFGEDERAGRWSGRAKTECGLHSLDDSSGAKSEHLA